MKALVQLTALGLLIWVVGLLSFIGIAKTDFAVPGKYITLGVFLIAMVQYLIAATELLSVWELVLLAVFLSVGSATIHNVLGFAFFPGLVKDVPPLSLHHFRGIGNEMMFLLVCYTGGILVSVGIKRVLKH